MFTFAYFISPHGFGHAARASAVMNALGKQAPCHFEIFTSVPAWFFAQSLQVPYRLHYEIVDVGLVQATPLNEDAPATAQRLQEIWFPSQAKTAELAGQVRLAGCQAVLCDIAPMGIVVADAAGVPSILIENFTWDYIYATYVADAPALQQLSDSMAEWFARAELHIQTAPITRPTATAQSVLPISRPPRTPTSEIRSRLGISPTAQFILLTMGGHSAEFSFLAELQQLPYQFVLPGNWQNAERRANCLFLPFKSELYHPDLVATADLVVGKIGYSTVAEAWQAGTRFAYIPRPRFLESTVMEAWMHQNMVCCEILQNDFEQGIWLYAQLPAILAQPRGPVAQENGADQVAKIVFQQLLTPAR
jgi:hypothetical protein